MQAALELYTSGGSQLAVNRNYRGSDALLDATLTDDGDYFLRVCSFAYVAGRSGPLLPPDRLNGPVDRRRLSAGRRAGQAGEADASTAATSLAASSIPPPWSTAGCWKRPPSRWTCPAIRSPRSGSPTAGLVSPASTALDGFEYRLHNDGGTSNVFLLTMPAPRWSWITAPTTRAKPRSRLRSPAKLPAAIEKKGDRDWYSFKAKKGDIYSIELYGERLGSPLDLYFTWSARRARRSLAPTIPSRAAEQGRGLASWMPHFYTRRDDPARYRFVVPGGRHLLPPGREPRGLLTGGPRAICTASASRRSSRTSA